MKAFVYLVFPNSILSVLPEGSSQVGGEPVEHGIITSVTHGVMSGIDYIFCGLFLWHVLMEACSLVTNIIVSQIQNSELLHGIVS